MEALNETIAPGGSARHESVPIDHLDYGYIEKCSNAKEIEKIVKILRSGSEGYYPDLLSFAERRLAVLKPKSDVLRTPKPVINRSDLAAEELNQFQDSIQQWHDEATTRDQHLREMNETVATEANLPPIRTNQTVTRKSEQKNNDSKPAKSNQVKSAEEWEKFDVDKELEKIEKDESEAGERASKPLLNFPTTDVTPAQDPLERELQAARAKDKGNEAFRSKDYDEALAYYTDSINYHPTAVSYNNRAMAAIKLEKYLSAIDDCDSVLQLDPNNVKAFLRRGVAKQNQHLYHEAESDFLRVLELEPNNSRGKKLLSEVRAKQPTEKAQTHTQDQQQQQNVETQKPKGRQLKIVEVGSSEDEDEKDEETKQSQETYSDDRKHDTTMSHKDDETSERLLDASRDALDDATDKYERELIKTGSTTESINEEGSEQVDINQNRTDELAASEQTDGSSTSKATHEEQRDDEYEELPPLEDDNSDETLVVPPVVSPVPLPEVVLRLKDEGVKLYRGGDFTQALERFSGAMDAMEDVREFHKDAYAALCSNRAACRFRQGECRACISDCDEGLNYNSCSSKLYTRKATALESLEKYPAAYVNFRAALAIDSNLTKAQEACTRLGRLLLNDQGTQWRQKLPPQPQPTQHVTQLTQTAGNASAATDVTLRESNVGKTGDNVSGGTTRLDSGSSPRSNFDDMKSKGNQLVKAGKFFEAAKCYTRCIEIDNTQTSSFTNRALCHLRLEKYQLAVQDCDKALQLDVNCVKAMYRRAQGKSKLQEFRNAAHDLTNLLKIEPDNEAATKELERVKQQWREQLEKQKQQAQDQKPHEQKSAQTQRAQEPETGKRKSNRKQQQQKQSKQSKSRKTKKNRGDSPSSSQNLSTPLMHNTEKELRLHDLPKAQVVDPPCKEFANKEGVTGGDGEGEEGGVAADVTDGDVKPMEPMEPKRTRVVIREVGSDYESSDDNKNQTKPANEQSSETVNSESPSDKTRPTEEEPFIPLKQLDKCTPYEFLQAWRSVRGHGRVACIQYAHLLRQIKPDTLPTILSNKLDGPMLMDILTAIADFIIADGEAQLGYELLVYLTKVPRFGVVSMFFSGKDKDVIRRAITSLQQHTDSGVISTSQLDTLRSSFSL